MQSIIITGGAGFIGSNFVRLVFEQTRDAATPLVVFDKLTYAGNPDNLTGLLDDSRVTFVQGDIADPETARSVFEDHQPKWLVNFAAESHVDRSIDDPGAFIRTNITGTYVLLDAARRYLASKPDLADDFRFLHVSTDEVYGSLGPTGAFTETTPYAPNSPYSASKAGADHLVRAWNKTFGLPTLLTNCSNNYGPYQFPEKLIPVMILNALEGRDLPVYGDGSNIRDWLHVEDHCKGILRVLEAGRPGEKYNLGGRAERTNMQLIEALLTSLESHRPAAENAALAERGKASYSDLITFVADRPGHDHRYAIDESKIHNDLGWQPEHDFESGIDATVTWYLDNLDWCESIASGGYRRERIGLAESSSRSNA